MLSFFYHATLSNEINVLNAVLFFFFYFRFNTLCSSNFILSQLYKCSKLFLNSLVWDGMTSAPSAPLVGFQDNIELSARNNVTVINGLEGTYAISTSVVGTELRLKQG